MTRNPNHNYLASIAMLVGSDEGRCLESEALDTIAALYSGSAWDLQPIDERS